ncbi:L,D-transpeptidase [Allorhizobium sp. BGMRC 0089]|uniref:L,D-transpeptidase family protein n=1 Tax=Allorhizobium sonneratiae TaxID=2934936 RepID=UPI002034A6AF|nr:L,D-transpeptidase [Allorhizobium sonneratiae]MCM2294172.1 L,D-transpeptidase [Allorhizobium sonneratiae]
MGAPAKAWDPFQRQRDVPDQATVLITPSGEVLNYVPERGSVTVMRDRMGHKILVDRYGNLVATEMPANEVYGRGYGSGGYDNGPNYGPDYYPPAPSGGGWDRSDTQTAGIPDDMPPDGDSADPSYAPDSPSTIPDQGPMQGDRTGLPPQVANPATVSSKATPAITALQVFLSREGFSPGAIDGRMGQNLEKALQAWEQKSGETLDPKDTNAIMDHLQRDGGLAFTTYTITAADAAGPYVASIPEDYSKKAAMPYLGYTSVAEMLAEKFHMDEGYLKALNPGVDFSVPGTTIKVVNLGTSPSGKVVKIIADKSRKQVFAYGADGQLIAAYPASIGSQDTPSPSGTVSVVRVAFNPTYTYNPKINFKQGSNDKVLLIPPGPNGPVGSVWIALSKPTYGIHGTPEPSLIGRTQSHGCVRLTNWDATALAKMVSPGVTVEFVG